MTCDSKALVGCRQKPRGSKDLPGPGAAVAGAHRRQGPFPGQPGCSGTGRGQRVVWPNGGGDDFGFRVGQTVSEG